MSRGGRSQDIHDERTFDMTRKHGIAAGIVLALGLATAGVYAHPEAKDGVEQHRHGATHHGAQGAQHMSGEARAAFHEKMRNATPEERQKLAQARRAEMHRGQADGAHSHPHRGAHGGSPAAPQSAPGQAN
jgi:hypothetical protein